MIKVIEGPGAFLNSEKPPDLYYTCLLPLLFCIFIMKNSSKQNLETAENHKENQKLNKNFHRGFKTLSKIT